MSDSRSPFLQRRLITAGIEPLIVFLICSALLLVLRIPYFGLPILYFDDGETLYHAFALLQGLIPYRDIYTHHFVGYVLPIAALVEIFGYSIDLIRWAYIGNQALLGVGIWLLSRLFFSRTYALVAAPLAVTAREPFVYSFFPLAQVSCLATFVTWLSLYGIKSRCLVPILCSTFLCSVGFLIDQRAILLLALPFLSTIMLPEQPGRRKIRNLLICCGTFIIIPASFLFVLWRLEILEQFIHQTFIFPARFRVASLSLAARLNTAFIMHRHLILDTPLLCALALIGYLRMTTSLGIRSIEDRTCLMILAFMPAVYFTMAALGGRDFSYYTLPWLPWLAVIAVFSVELLERWGRLITCVILLSPLAITALSMPAFLAFVPELTRRDEALRIASFINQEASPDETLFVFGYRPDIYASIPKLGASPLVNVIYIHPDSLIREYNQRLNHIDPDIEREFMDWFNRTPPDWLVIADLGLGEADDSPSATLVKGAAAEKYSLRIRTNGPTVEGKPTSLSLYRRNPTPAGEAP